MLKNICHNCIEWNNKNILIAFHFFPDVLIGIGWATIHKVCVEQLPTQWLSFEQLMLSVFLILACSLWKIDRFREKSLKLFLYLSIFEMLSGMLLAFSMAVYFNVWIFAIGSLLYTGAISVLLNRVETAFKSKLFNFRDREDFDNDMQLACSLSSLIGFGIASIVSIPISSALLLWGIAWIGNLGWIIVYIKNRKNLS